jgi:2-iminobutanoate/2-iminopropanoate deaminase
MVEGGGMTARRGVHTDAAPSAIGPYGQAVLAGDFVFASGQVGADPSSGALADGVAAQADRALRNLAAVLEAAGTDLGHVVKTTIFLTDMGDFTTVNEVYARYLKAPFPARSTVAVAALPKGALVEIEMVAQLSGSGPAGS